MIFNSIEPQIIVLLIPALVFSLSFHEFAHAWMAHRLGDNTAARLGRLTLNPMSHLDPVGSIALLLMGFGWAKPVPVDSKNLDNPKHLDFIFNEYKSMTIIHISEPTRTI